MKHLKDNNMGYFEHLGFALKLSGQLVIMAVIGVVHAVLPFIFANSVSAGVKAMDAKLQEVAG
jgi:hypothetical protein